MTRRAIFTIGYEAQQADDVMRRLHDAGVSQLLDVRLRPQSRKPGLSKTALNESCNALGIEYLHDRRLGTPAEMLDAVRENGGYENWDDYRDHLDTQTDALAETLEIVDMSATALLCYELNPNECHRSVVAEYLSRSTGMPITHL